MPSFLPANLLALFAPRDPIPFLPPPDKLPHEKKTNGYTGVGEYLHIFEDPKDTPPPTRVETREERQKRRKREKAEQVAYKLEQDIALWDPYNNAAATSDAYKTLFVARINYDTSESKLRREFEVYGPIKKIGIVHDKNTGKPRGYAFIEYEHARDMHSAYKHADGKKIDGRRILVDVERGRTVKGWLPRRLGGGLGGTRRGGPEVNVKHSGREERLEDRYINDRSERGRDRDDRERERERRRGSRSRSRERRRRSRSRSRERRRESRHRREKSRERVRDRDLRDIEKMDGVDGNVEVIAPEIEKKERGRKRSRSRDRKRRRSRSRDRSSKRRERDRDRESSRREKVRDKDDRITGEETQAKQETSQDGYSSGSVGYEGGEFDSKFTSDANSFNNNSYGDGDRNVYNSEDYS